MGKSYVDIFQKEKKTQNGDENVLSITNLMAEAGWKRKPCLAAGGNWVHCGIGVNSMEIPQKNLNKN